ncbi:MULTISPECIES: DUF6507 family protein [Streptomyces]|uniref:Uncharacterized protein n=2 Tax=Streptomyces TaxID=1883 RepID=A0A0W7WQZ3_9ACTN|nr:MULTISPECIES: DUF6507 family protein [Streptomyces]KUF13018.1 hypothetical protein AT728_37390 [Streptomyces silvensis]MVO83410.1 hypothetical protein [Streptomyces typhae]
MPAWDISPSGVESVTSLVGLAMDDMAKDIKAYGTDVESAATSAGTISGGDCGKVPTGPVGIALALFVDRTMGDVLSLGARAGKSVNGAIEATNHYLRGDQEKAAIAQRNAAKAVDVEALLEAARKKGGKG